MPKSSSGTVPEADASNVERYIEALREHPNTNWHMTGMVKASPNSDGLLVAHLGDCKRWAHIPASAIDKVTETGRLRCGTHTHPIADIQLKEPRSDTEVAYAALANLHRAKLDDVLTSSLGGGGYNCGPGEHWGQDQYGNWGCQVGP